MHLSDLNFLAGFLSGLGVGVAIGAVLTLRASTRRDPSPKTVAPKGRSDGLWAVLLRHYFQD